MSNLNEKLKSWLGEPTFKGEKVTGWEQSTLYDPYVRIEIEDEYVTSYVKIPLDPEQACKLMLVSRNILIDLFKGEVGTRSDGLIKNDVVLSFVEDVAGGVAKPSKREYATRIKNNMITREKYNSAKLLFYAENGGFPDVKNTENSCILS